MQRPYQTLPCAAPGRHLPSMQYCTCFVDGDIGHRASTCEGESWDSLPYFSGVEICTYMLVYVNMCAQTYGRQRSTLGVLASLLS